MQKPLSRIRRASEAGGDVGSAFREAMSLLAAAVVMVTTRIDGRPWSLTISSCCSVSVAPPMILISLGHERNWGRDYTELDRGEPWYH
jgi:flavin reductase (DIM6/NTAB) family NADH-FMN oxidoreductase RutF